MKLILLILIFSLAPLLSWADEDSKPFWTTSWTEEWLDQIKYLRDGPSIRERISLRAGPSLASRVVRASESSKENMTAGGFNTSFCVDLTGKIELAVAGYVLFGRTRQLDINLGGDHLHTDGKYRDTTFSPNIRYLTSLMAFQNWYWYFMGGPAWSQQSVHLRDYVDNQGVSRHDHKVTIESEGGEIGLGIQEILPNKKMHPVYAEFIFSYMVVRKMTLVDASNFDEVETIKYEEMHHPRPISGVIYLLNFGMTLF